MIGVVDNDIETLATALYVKIDDMLTDWPDLAPARPADRHSRSRSATRSC